MSLDSYEDSRRRMNSIQARLNETIDSLRANTSLSPQGRRAEMARATVAATQMADKVKDEIVTARKQQRDQLEKHLFGLSPNEGGILAARDAADRAAKIEALASDPETITKARDAASAALGQAQLSGDRSLQRAITHLAVTKGWTSVVNAYVDGLPATESTPTALSLQKLSAIPAGRNADLADAAVFRVRPPTELGICRPSDLEHLARDAAPAQQQIAETTAGWAV
jgi:hypothetical protein